MLIIGGSVSGKTNSLPTLVKEQDSENLIDKIYWYVKDFTEPKYQFLIKKHEVLEIKYLNDPKAYIEYSQYLADICNNINDYSQMKKRKILIVFDGRLLIQISIEKFNP